MTTDLNLYRELDTNIKPRNFEIFCMETLKSYAEQEHLQNFKIAHDQKVETDDGTYQIDVLAEYTALGVKNTVTPLYNFLKIKITHKVLSNV